MAKKTEVIEEYKMKWPDGMERTRINDRESKSAWKKSAGEYKKALALELERLGATSILISMSDNERMDPGVAVWFSRGRADFSWQQGLGLENPAPTFDEIDSAFREKARGCHQSL